MARQKDEPDPSSIIDMITAPFKKRGEVNLRETIEEFIVDENREEIPSVSSHERTLISNILELRDTTVDDIMVPRADIVAISSQTTQKELLELLSQKQFSRIPVYSDSLDDVIGSIHIKDIMSALAAGKKIKLVDILRDVPFVSPSMPILDLLLEMRQSQKHMALVVDEYGGIDGLITITGVIESIIGQIDDEYDSESLPELLQKDDGTIIADARYEIEDFEEEFGEIFTEDDREESETLGGLVFTLAGRIPARGEVITHDNGIVFEILDADPRRINRLRLRNVPRPALTDE